MAYDGYRVKLAGHPEVYVVIDNAKHHVPDPATYNNLFENWTDIQEIPAADFNAVPTGLALTSGAVLAKGSAPEVYLITNGVRRHVMSPETMDKYDFGWNKVVLTPDAVINGIPFGPTVR